MNEDRTKIDAMQKYAKLATTTPLAGSLMRITVSSHLCLLISSGLEDKKIDNNSLFTAEDRRINILNIFRGSQRIYHLPISRK